MLNVAGCILHVFIFQPYKYLHCVRLVEAGLATLAQDYVRVLGDYVVASVAGGHIIDQETVPGWVGYTAYLAEKLKYLVSMTMK